MRLATIGLVLLSVGLTSGAQIALKAGMTAPAVKTVIESGSPLRMATGLSSSPLIVFGLLSYGLSAIVWLLVLSRVPLSTAYPFIALGIAIINAVANKKVSLAELVAVNFVITGLVAFLELHPRAQGTGATPYLYDRLDLLRPGQESALHADLATRTGLEITKVHVHRVDLLRDAAEITVHYRKQAP